MAIEVGNHLWVAICGASYATQVHERIARGEGPPDDIEAVRMMDEAKAVADQGIEAWTISNAKRVSLDHP